MPIQEDATTCATDSTNPSTVVVIAEGYATVATLAEHGKAATEISSWPVYRYPSLGLTHIDQVGRGDGRKFHLLRLRAVRLVRGSKRQFHLVRQNPSKRGGAKYSALAIQTCPTGADFEQLTDLFG
jgi:hypothetical protein